MKKIAVVISLLTLFLIGCSSNHVDDSKQDDLGTNSNMQDDISDVETNVSFMDYDEKYKLYQNHYPDKVILTWLTDNYVRYEWELNEYLSNNNYDYVICFRPLNIVDASGFTNTYLNAITELIYSGEQIDIIDGFSTVLGQDVVSNVYFYLADNGIYEPLDTYLDSNKYSDIKNSLPQKYWDSYKYNGKIYGVDNSFSSLYSDNGLLIYNDVFEQTGIQADDFNKPLSELETVLRSTFDKTGRSINYDCGFWTYDIFTANYITAVGLAVSDNKAINVFEQDEVLNYYELLNLLSEKEYITIDSASTVSAGYNIELKAAYGEIIENDIAGTTKVFNKRNNYICNPTNVMGISSKSLNKDMAVDALINVVYNETFNNILTYGVEGIQYEISDGKVVMKENEMYDGGTYIVDSHYNNSMISLPCYNTNNEIISHDYYSAYETAEYLDGFGFLFDGTEIKDTYINVVNAICEFKPLNEDFDAYISTFNQNLYDAGLQEVLDEANKQLEVYNEKNN